MLATSVLASSTSKTGYEILRDSIENTVVSSVNFKSYTTNSSVIVKFDNEVVYSQTITQMRDYINQKDLTERWSKSLYYDDSYYFDYSDSEKRIYSSNGNDYVLLEINPIYHYDYVPSQISDYEIQYIKTMKKIADAAVITFNMQNVITPLRDNGGGYKLIFSFNEGQIPALVNALSSVLLQETFSDLYYTALYKSSEVIEEYETESTAPMLIYNNSYIEYDTYKLEDIYMKYANGEAYVDKDNLFNKVSAKAGFAGVDINGDKHKFEIEILYEMKDIDSTVINEPDLTGKNVRIGKEWEDPYYPNKPGKPGVPRINFEVIKPLLGKYVNNIIEISGDKMIKTGEYYLELNEIDEEACHIKALRYKMVNGEKLDVRDVILDISYFNEYDELIFMRDSRDNLYEFYYKEGYIMIYEHRNLIFTRVFE